MAEIVIAKVGERFSINAEPFSEVAFTEAEGGGYSYTLYLRSGREVPCPKKWKTLQGAVKGLARNMSKAAL